MVNALVTGANGFIGRHIVEALRKKNMDVLTVDLNGNHILDHLPTNNELEVDVASPHFFEWFDPPDFDYIFHFGSPCSVIQFNKDPVYCVRNTLKGFRNVLSLAQVCGAKLIYPSSGNVYGDAPLPQNESMTPNPNNLYAVCKLEMEELAKWKDIDTVGLRIFAGYGEGEERKGDLASVVCLFLSQMLSNQKPLVWGDGKQERDFIHIDDVTNAIMASMKLDGHIVVNVGTGVKTSYNRLVEILNDALETNFEPTRPVDYWKDPMPSNYVNVTQADTTLMSELLEIKPKPLEDGIKQFVSYLIEAKEDKE